MNSLRRLARATTALVVALHLLAAAALAASCPCPPCRNTEGGAVFVVSSGFTVGLNGSIASSPDIGYAVGCGTTIPPVSVLERYDDGRTFYLGSAVTEVFTETECPGAGTDPCDPVVATTLAAAMPCTGSGGGDGLVLTGWSGAGQYINVYLNILYTMSGTLDPSITLRIAKTTPPYHFSAPPPWDPPLGMPLQHTASLLFGDYRVQLTAKDSLCSASPTINVGETENYHLEVRSTAAGQPHVCLYPFGAPRPANCP